MDIRSVRAACLDPPGELDPSRQATLSCVTLLSRAWQRSTLQVAAGGCVETWREQPQTPTDRYFSLSIYSLVYQHRPLLVVIPCYRASALYSASPRGGGLDSTARRRAPHGGSLQHGALNHPQEPCEGRHPLQLHIRSSQTLSTRQGVADVWLKIDPTTATRHSRGLYFMMARFLTGRWGVGEKYQLYVTARSLKCDSHVNDGTHIGTWGLFSEMSVMIHGWKRCCQPLEAVSTILTIIDRIIICSQITSERHVPQMSEQWLQSSASHTLTYLVAFYDLGFWGITRLNYLPLQYEEITFWAWEYGSILM